MFSNRLRHSGARLWITPALLSVMVFAAACGGGNAATGTSSLIEKIPESAAASGTEAGGNGAADALNPGNGSTSAQTQNADGNAAESGTDKASDQAGQDASAKTESASTEDSGEDKDGNKDQKEAAGADASGSSTEAGTQASAESTEGTTASGESSTESAASEADTGMTSSTDQALHAGSAQVSGQYLTATVPWASNMYTVTRGSGYGVDSVSFYDASSEAAGAGGHLFTIACYASKADYADLPSKQYVGSLTSSDGQTTMYVVAVFPTDVQSIPSTEDQYQIMEEDAQTVIGSLTANSGYTLNVGQ